MKRQNTTTTIRGSMQTRFDRYQEHKLKREKYSFKIPKEGIPFSDWSYWYDGSLANDNETSISNIKEFRGTTFNDVEKPLILKQYIDLYNHKQKQDLKQIGQFTGQIKTRSGYKEANGKNEYHNRIQQVIDQDWLYSNYEQIEKWISFNLKPVFITYTLTPEHNHSDYSQIKSTIKKQKAVFQRRMEKLRANYKVKDIYTFELTKRLNIHLHALVFVEPEYFDKFIKNTHKYAKQDNKIGETDIQFIFKADQERAIKLMNPNKGNVKFMPKNSVWVVKDTDNSLQITKMKSDLEEGKLNAFRTAKYIFKYLDKDDTAPLFHKKEIFNTSLQADLIRNGITKKHIKAFFDFILIPTSGFDNKNEFNIRDNKFKRDFMLRYLEISNNFRMDDDGTTYLEKSKVLLDSMNDTEMSLKDKREIFIKPFEHNLLSCLLPFTNLTHKENNWHIVLKTLPFTFENTTLHKLLNINSFDIVLNKGSFKHSMTNDIALSLDFDLPEMEANLFSKWDEVNYKEIEKKTNSVFSNAFILNKNFEPTKNSSLIENHLFNKNSENIKKESEGKTVLEILDLANDFQGHQESVFTKCSFLKDNPLDSNKSFSGSIIKDEKEMLNKAFEIWKSNPETVFLTKDNNTANALNKIIDNLVSKVNKKESNSLPRPVIFKTNISEQGIVKSTIYEVVDFSNVHFGLENKVLLLNNSTNKYLLIDKGIMSKAKSAYCITVNNSQGRSINNVCFIQSSSDYVNYSHFYVAVSRTKKQFSYLLSEEVYSRILITAKGKNFTFNDTTKTLSYSENVINTGLKFSNLSTKDFNTYTKKTGLFQISKQDAINSGLAKTDIVNSNFVSVIKKLNTKIQSLKPEAIEPLLSDPDLSEEQLKAVNIILSNSFSVIRGDGGTGKTFLVSKMIEHLRNKGFEEQDIKVVAFTNTAVEVLRGNIKECYLSTIHRLLGMGGSATKVSIKPEAKIIIVDESSMASFDLFYLLINALNTNTRIVFLGDQKQLPPVNTFDFFSYLNPDITLVNNQRVSNSFGLDYSENISLAIQKVISFKDNDIVFNKVQGKFHSSLSYFEDIIYQQEQDEALFVG